MKAVFTNGSNRDFVCDIFDRFTAVASTFALAAPYFTDAKRVLAAAERGGIVNLIVGLNAATSPFALAEVHKRANVHVRYFTSRFHAKIYVFDDLVLLGSSNLTDGGLVSNREAVIRLDRSEDAGAIEEVKLLFTDLWDAALVLTDEQLARFTSAWKKAKRDWSDPDLEIEKAIGRAEPVNINVASRTKSRERLFLESLRRLVYEQYRPAFAEVESVLVGNGFHRPELEQIGPSNEANRFLNWLRLTYAPGEESWRDAPLRSEPERRAFLTAMGAEWRDTPASRVPVDYVDWLGRVDRAFSDRDRLSSASLDEVTDGLMALHAFTEQSRFVKGGMKNLPAEFWRANSQDLDRVRRTIGHLVHGPGDYIGRLHDVLFSPEWKLAYFGQFCALELFGTLRPELCPPMNGRMAKALRFAGFNVPGG
jgi:hypothetical protein